MKRLRTFLHQKRFRHGFSDAGAHLSAAPVLNGEEVADLYPIDHRLMENHRMKWKKWADWLLYILAVAFVGYWISQWFNA